MKRESFRSWLAVGGIILLLCWAVFVLTIDLSVVVKDDEKPPEKSFASSVEEPQPVLSVVSESAPVEVEEMRDANTRVFKIQKEIAETDPATSQTTIDTVESTIVEKCPNLCYKDEAGAWQLTDTSFEAIGNEFRMNRSGYKILMGRTLTDPINFSADGKTISLKLSHFIISDGVNTQEIGALNNETIGNINADNRSKVLFQNPFGNNIADVEYAAEKGGFHQNIIINRAINLPQGFAAENANLYVYTELLLNDFISDQNASIKLGADSVNFIGEGIVADAGNSDTIEFKTIVEGKENLTNWFAESEIISNDGKKILAARVPGSIVTVPVIVKSSETR